MLLTKVEKLMMFEGKFRKSAAEYPAYSPPTPSVWIVRMKTSLADPTIPTCIRCLITSLGTRMADDVMFPTAAARGGISVFGQLMMDENIPLPISYVPMYMEEEIMEPKIAACTPL